MKIQPETFKYLLSRYLRIREKNGNVAVFHDLHANPIYCTKSEWEDFIKDINQSMNSDLFKNLKQKRLIVKSKEEDDEEFRAISMLLESKLNQPTIKNL